MDTDAYLKIDGYFYPGDVLAYRELVAQVPDGGRVVEIGVYRGRSLCSIGPLCKARNIQLEGVDPYAFTGGGGEISGDRMYDIAHWNVWPFAELHRVTSLEAAKMFDDACLDLVMIDGPHDYANVRQDILAWLPKIKDGGWIAGHDYCPKWPGVAQAVREIFGDGDFSANVNETDYCVMWKKQVRRFNITAGNACRNLGV